MPLFTGKLSHPGDRLLHASAGARSSAVEGQTQKLDVYQGVSDQVQ